MQKEAERNNQPPMLWEGVYRSKCGNYLLGFSLFFNGTQYICSIDSIDQKFKGDNPVLNPTDSLNDAQEQIVDWFEHRCIEHQI